MTNYANPLHIKKRMNVVTYIFLLSIGRTTHVTKDMCFLGREKHITIHMCCAGRGRHITRNMCFPGWGTHITDDVLTHITDDVFPGKGNTYH